MHANAIAIGRSILRVSLDTNVVQLVAEISLIETAPGGARMKASVLSWFLPVGDWSRATLMGRPPFYLPNGNFRDAAAAQIVCDGRRWILASRSTKMPVLLRHSEYQLS